MTREEWLRHAVEQLDSILFAGDLDILNHQFQISCGRCPGKKLTECIQPYDGEDVKLDDFFPTTLTVNFTIKDPIERLGALALECIHAFFNIKGTNKQFKKLAAKYYFEKPYTQYTPSLHLIEILNEVNDVMKQKYGEFPGKPIVFHKKETEKKKTSFTVFCPDCGFEMKVSNKMLKKYGKNMPTCPCGAKMALDEGEDEEVKE